MRIELALKDIIENRFCMTFIRDLAIAAYEDIGGAFTGKESVAEFELAYMTRIFA